MTLPIPQPDYELVEMIDGTSIDRQKKEHALACYEAGASVDEIGEYLGVTGETVRKQLKALHGLDDYKESVKRAKQARVNATKQRLNKITTKSQEKALEMLEKDSDDITPQVLCSFQKTFGDKLAIMEGEATERTEHTGIAFTIEMPDGFKGENIGK